MSNRGGTWGDTSRLHIVAIALSALVGVAVRSSAAEVFRFTAEDCHFIDLALHPGTVLTGGEVPASDCAVAVVRSFPANKGPGWKASIDIAGAVGPRHVVDFDVAHFVVHDKANGRILRRLSTREFWQRVEPAGMLVPQKDANDARILYDPLSERWFACAAGTTEPDCFLAVSTSSDPTEPWRGAKLPLPRINPYMKMGVDRNGLYICSCNGNADPQRAMNCHVIPKNHAIAPDGPVLTHTSDFPALQFSSMPATDLDPDKAADAPMILLTNEFGDGICDKLYLYRITWSGLTASLSDVQIVPFKNVYQTPNNHSGAMEAVQPKPGPKLHAGGGGRRNDSVFVHGGSVFGCNGAKRTPGSRPGVLWYEIRISDGALLHEGFVDSPDRDFIFPSIAVDGHGNVGVGCTGTSKTEFPSVYVMMRAESDPPGTMRGPVRAVPGSTSYHYAGVRAINLSHYSTTCIDPSDPGLLWTCQAYGNSTVDRQWCTAWAAFQLAKSLQSATNATAGTDAQLSEPELKWDDSTETETFTGAAARSGMYKRPLLDVDDKRYELKASSNANASVADILAKFSRGDAGTYVVKGTRGTVKGNDGIIVDSIVVAAETPPNTLTPEEKAAGWRLLFDGRTTNGWRGYKTGEMPPGWQVIDHALVRVSGGKGGMGAGGGDDIITVDQFESFELKLEWKVAPGGNSGILYRVVKGAAATWHVAPEMQVLDNTPHPNRKKSQLAGALYDLYAPARDVTRAVGEWNEARVVANENHVEHWLNGVKLFEYEVGSRDWETRVARSKFASKPQFAKARKGHICLQDHTKRLEYRNIKIREL